MARIAFSDIHGCNNSFRSLLEQLQIQRDDELYILGDLINKGPNSKGVLDTILELRAVGHRVLCLRGNHEHMMMEARNDQSLFENWLGWGGAATMNSFNAKRLTEIPEKYWELMEGMGFFFELPDAFLVHAGFNFDAPDPLQDTRSMIFIRDWHHKIDPSWLGDKILVHGHIQTEKEIVETQHQHLKENQVLNIDSGCVSPHLPGRGFLCAFNLDARSLHFQPNVEVQSNR